jgi:hydrogenase nickel incorporation protein HypA/HybF
VALNRQQARLAVSFSNAELKYDGLKNMHEYGLTKEIIRIAENAARREGAHKISRISLVVGENAGILPDSIQMYFDFIAKGTLVEGATLQLRMVPVRMRCPRCDKNFERPLFSFVCPDCGALGHPTKTGNEFYVESLELEI